MGSLLHGLRFVLAGICGYAVIALLTTLVLENWLGGVDVLTAGGATLVVASTGGVLSGFAGGVVAGLFRRPAGLLHALPVTLFLAIDTTYISVNQIGDSPIWFKLLSGAALAAAALLGGWAVQRWSTKSRGATE